ncbi:gephyrin-like molybdotransferase Glp [Acetobacterium carbinolicum]|jgi:molybdopterin molybdotransferase|uniref:molybdopterin molybdotransferase MoeA n=1 Tax=Acetobacterium TaxID=33951 RepID=UPI000DBEB608|nr:MULTISPECIES: gephyrin-like molybdotransferase Glp [unclassified Acetobacterium]AWW28292.1 molybdopterin molybdenumtransferase MoeA [Acetobacterium sp. KB-1]MDZ5725033.1 gephyrin-like molybdotransferase Glp [Acetobacterium sp. K1/6]
MELLKVKTIDEMKNIIKETFRALTLEKETIDLSAGLGRVLSADIVSTMDVPHFDRSVVDGYAVKLTDVQGAGSAIPGFLRIVGEVQMGKETTESLNQGETLYVPTGGMVPAGTEAMIMIEYTEKLGEKDLAIYTNAGANENMMRIGDDIRNGELVFSRGHLLRPQDIGVLSALGYLQVEVYKRPRLSIISTGDEIIRPGETPKPGEVIDINTPALAAVAKRLGADVISTAYARDDQEEIRKAVELGIKNGDMVILSGGSSMGEKDYTVQVIDGLGEVLLHGLAVKPGKPTILGSVLQKPVIGLPGQPAAAIMVLMIVLQEFMKRYYDQDSFNNQTIQGVLMENIHASPGRRTFQTVAIKKTEKDIEIRPTHGKSGMITLLSYSDGYIEITENEEGKNAGDRVEVTLF